MKDVIYKRKTDVIVLGEAKLEDERKEKFAFKEIK